MPVHLTESTPFPVRTLPLAKFLAGAFHPAAFNKSPSRNFLSPALATKPQTDSEPRLLEIIFQ